MSNITNQPVRFIACTDTQYDSLPSKENNVIYFVAGSNDNYRICLGENCFNVKVIKSLDGITTDFDVPSSHAVKMALNNKVNRPNIETITDTTLPATITPLPDHEYRYLNLDYTGTTTPTLEVAILREYLEYFYISIILHGINFTGNVSDFITAASGDTYVNTIRFLNDVELSNNDTAEILLFTNGLNICCIASAYDSTQS